MLITKFRHPLQMFAYSIIFRMQINVIKCLKNSSLTACICRERAVSAPSCERAVSAPSWERAVSAPSWERAVSAPSWERAEHIRTIVTKHNICLINKTAPRAPMKVLRTVMAAERSMRAPYESLPGLP